LKTIVRSLRISEKLWAKIGEIAEREGKSRNSVINGLISAHCEKSQKMILTKPNNCDKM
jgi:hypothetical protein